MTDTQRPELDKCRCSLRERLVGDGYQYCNPELHEWLEKLSKEEEDE